MQAFVETMKISRENAWPLAVNHFNILILIRSPNTYVSEGAAGYTRIPGSGQHDRARSVGAKSFMTEYLHFCIVVQRDSGFWGEGADTRIWTALWRRKEGVRKQASSAIKSNENGVMCIDRLGCCHNDKRSSDASRCQEC